VKARDNYANYAIIISTIISTFFYVEHIMHVGTLHSYSVQHASWNLYKSIGAIKSLIQ